jgi:hypothetical protein
VQPQPTETPLDAVTVAVVVITAVAGGEVAKYAGPYLVILAAAIVGAVLSLMRRPDAVPRWHALAWVAWLALLSLLFTGAVAAGIELVLQKLGWAVPSRYLLVPVSLAIAAVGKDWPQVGLWAAGLFRRRMENKVGGE